MGKILKRPTITEKISRYKNKFGLTIAAIAAIGTFSLTDPFSSEKQKTTENETPTIEKVIEDEALTIGILKDRDDDNFENSIPLYADSKLSHLSTQLKDGTVFITEGNLMDNNTTTHKIYTFNNSGTIVSGYIEKKYATHSAVVDSKHSNIYIVKEEKGANLRSAPEITPDNRRGTIPYKSLVVGDAGNSWTNVIYLTSDSIKNGYVSSELLEKKTNLFSKDKDIHNKDNEPTIKYVVEKGEVFGIDVSGICEKQLRKLLTGEVEIPNKIPATRSGNVDISEYTHKKPNFVYIKLGASKMFSTEISPSVSPDYQALASVCEELGVPYGFYYYSTCITKEEAKKEADLIKENLAKLTEQKYNLLPFAIDVEVFIFKDLPAKHKPKADSKKDRQYNRPMKEVTSSKAELANLLEPTTGKTTLYTNRNATDDEWASRFIDIKQYQQEIRTGESHIWFVAPKGDKRHEQSMQKFIQYVKARQIVLDAKTDNTKRNLIDINVIDADAFKSYLDGTYNEKGLQFAKTNSQSKTQQVASNDRTR